MSVPRLGVVPGARTSEAGRDRASAGPPRAALAPEPPPVDDEALLLAVAQGDDGALTELHRRHRSRLRRLVARLLGSAADVDDCVQEVFLVVWRRAGSFRAGSPVRPWLSGIATNVVRSRRRGEQRRRLLRAALGREPVVAPPEPERLVLGAERSAQLWAAVERLPARLREAFVLCEVDELGGTDAARALGVPPGTMWRRLHEARQRLRAVLDDKENP